MTRTAIVGRAFAGLCLFLTMGCTTETSSTLSVTDAKALETGVARAMVATGSGLVANPRAVPPAKAKLLFDAICGDSLPDFASAPQRMAVNGFTRTSPIGTATMYSQTDDASFQITPGDRCSMVVGTTATAQQMRDVMMRPAADSVRAVPYRGTTIRENRDSRDNGRTYIGFSTYAKAK